MNSLRYFANLKDWMVIDMANPFVLGSSTDNAMDNQALPEFKEYAWDFTKNTFIYDENGKHKIVNRNEAIKIWVYKALMTERYRYRAYFDDYGGELEHFIGTVPNDDKEAGEVYRYIEEALLVNPYILEIENISAEQAGKAITLNIALTTVYGSATLGIEV